MLTHFLGKSQRACLCAWNLEVWWQGLGGNLGSRVVLTAAWWFCPWGTCSVTVLIWRRHPFGESPGNLWHLTDASARRSTCPAVDQALCSPALHVSSFPQGILKIAEDPDVIPWSWKLMGIPSGRRAPESSLDVTCTAWGVHTRCIFIFRPPGLWPGAAASVAALPARAPGSAPCLTQPGSRGCWDASLPSNPCKDCGV